MLMAPLAKRHSAFTPDEIDRMPVADARWLLEDLPVSLRVIAELELAGDDRTAGQIYHLVSLTVSDIRRRLAGVTPEQWRVMGLERLRGAMPCA